MPFANCPPSIVCGTLKNLESFLLSGEHA